MEHVEIVEKIIAAIFKGDSKRKKEYYDCLLKPYAMEYLKDDTVDAVSFVQNNAKRDNDSIPKYVFYLMGESQKKSANNIDKEEAKENLRKVLLTDYLELYDNDDNSKLSIMRMVKKGLIYVMFFMTFAFIFAGALGTVNFILSILEINSEVIDIRSVIIGIISFALGIVTLILSLFLSDDMYTTKISKINRIVKRKVRCFKEPIGVYVL